MQFIESIRKIYDLVLGIPKTIIFNFYYFPFNVAIKLPVWVSHRVWLKNLGGHVEMAEIKTGIVKIGFGDVGVFDSHVSRSIWLVSGKVSFNGRANIGHGCKINVSGRLSIADNLVITAESTIIAYEKIDIGKNALISWDVLIMDTDFHPIYNLSDNRIINQNKAIKIGDNVWIGCRSMILKGVEISDGNIIAASSIITKSINDKNVITGGHPTRIIKNNIKWKV